MDDDELMRLAARGQLAGAVAAELAAPLDRVARLLEKAVDRLDRHVAGSRGPEALPYQAVGELRERIAQAFLDLGRIARLAGDLASVSAGRRERAVERVDVNELVERALSLARHRFEPDCEVLLDLGTLPVTEVDGVRVVEALAHLLIDTAEATRAGGTVTVNTTEERGAIRVSLGYPAAPHGPSPFLPLVERSLLAEGGQITYSSDGERALAVVSLPVRK